LNAAALRGKMLVIRYLSARLIKIIGNGSKAISHLFHVLRPNKRFSIPHRASPWIAGRGQHRVPKIIWQTNYTDRVTFAVYLNYLFNRLMSPTYEYRFMITAEREAYIKENCSAEIFEAYSRLQIGAAQADLWRLLVLRKFGGVYMDIDAHVVWPLGYMIERDADELYILERLNRFSNYFIATVPNNPHIDLAIHTILGNIKNPQSQKVVHLTGPVVFEKVLQPLKLPAVSYRYTCIQGTFTNEYFQYIDHPQGKYTRVQRQISVLKDREPPAP
jgi:mannosyltransferase OCH1-like enzyme